MSNCPQYNKKDEKEFVVNELKKSGGRITQQRLSIINAILNFNSPFCAEDLFHKIEDKGVDLTTVYRFLNSLLDLNILKHIDFQDGVQRFEYVSNNSSHHHHHIICKKCRNIEPIDICISNQEIKKILKLGYKNITHNLEFFALCEKCQ